MLELQQKKKKTSRRESTGLGPIQGSGYVCKKCFDLNARYDALKEDLMDFILEACIPKENKNESYMP